LKGFTQKFPENYNLAEKIYTWMKHQANGNLVDLSTFMRTSD